MELDAVGPEVSLVSSLSCVQGKEKVRVAVVMELGAATVGGGESFGSMITVVWSAPAEGVYV